MVGRGEVVGGLGTRGLVVDVGGNVDGTCERWGGDDVAGGAEGVGGEELAPLAVAEVAAQADGGGVLGAAESVGFEMRGGGAGGNDVDDAAEGAGAVEIGAAPGGNGDGVERVGGDFVPVDPSAEGIVQGDVVLEDEGAAGGGGAEAAERDALTGGVLDAGAGAAEEFEAGLLAEFVVERDGGIVVEAARADGVDGVGGGGQVHGRARGGDRDLLHDGGRM